MTTRLVPQARQSKAYMLRMTKPTHFSISTNSTECSSDDLKIPKDEDSSVHWLGKLKLDPYYVSSLSPIKLPHDSEHDLLSGLDWFTKKDVCPYNCEDWEKIINKVEGFKVDEKRVDASVYAGLPNSLRGNIWSCLAFTDELRNEYKLKGITYKDLIKTDHPDEHLITKDILRSFKEMTFFQKQDKKNIQTLYRILCAYANFDEEIGYTQGLNFLAGMILFFVNSEKCVKDIKPEEYYEEEAFWTLVYIMRLKYWRMMYADDTPKLLEIIDELDVKLQNQLPKLYKHLSDNIPNCLATCFPQYCLTLLIFNTPYDFAKRCLEFFLIGGQETLIHIIIKLLIVTEQDILERKTIEELIHFIKFELVTFAIGKYPHYFERFLAYQIPF